MKKVLIFCPYPVDTVPGQRLKYEQYILILESVGFIIRVDPFFSSKTFQILYKKGFWFRKALGVFAGIWRRVMALFVIPRYDGIYIFLNYIPIGPALLERLAVRLAKKCIYDIDDMVHLLETGDNNRLVSLFRSSSRYYFLMRSADHVITCTPFLQELALQYNSAVSDISSTVDTKRYVVVQKYANNAPVVLGWSGSHSTVKYLKLLADVLQEVSSLRRVKLLVFGCDLVDIDVIEKEVVPFTSQAEVSTLQRMDIGLYPLQDEEWVKGKSGLKAIQYMAVGLPVVASALGCNSRVIEHGVSGYLVRSRSEWVTALLRLIDSPSLRQKLGLSGRNRVEQLFSVEKNKSEYIRVFKTVYGEGAP